MGLFESLGRRVEQFKQTAKEAAEENATYRCAACGSQFNAHDGTCPKCGADAVVTVETEAVETEEAEPENVGTEEVETEETETEDVGIEEAEPEEGEQT
ncbi:hypothetical protein OB905_00010 [Halobacteria archaeon AArc-dxtr1]|nr:hypothetical protein [Halobacteria archaeon AArc-dxtr1]